MPNGTVFLHPEDGGTPRRRPARAAAGPRRVVCGPRSGRGGGGVKMVKGVKMAEGKAVKGREPAYQSADQSTTRPINQFQHEVRAEACVIGAGMECAAPVPHRGGAQPPRGAFAIN
eukprot:gene13759-biopygen12121